MNDKTIGRINRLRDQSFEDAYRVHDVGTAYIRDRIAEYDLTVFEHGDDKRDENVYSGTGIDLGVVEADSDIDDGTVGTPTEVLSWIEVKTKRSEEWLGRCNHEDWTEYRGFATYVEEDVYVFFAHVTDVESAMIDTWYFVRVPPLDEDDIAVKLPFKSKGHEIVEANDAHAVGWPTVVGSCIDELS